LGYQVAAVIVELVVQESLKSVIDDTPIMRQVRIRRAELTHGQVFS
jgi:hypothetical protein